MVANLYSSPKMLFGNIFWFIVLDLEDTLYYKPLSPESQELFAFEWNDPETSVKPSFWMVLPQGFKNASTIFRELSVQFSSVQSLSCVQLFATPWTAARQASLSITNSWSLLKLMSIESVMPSNHPVLCHPLLLLPSIFPSIRVFSNESALCIRWPKYWSFNFNINLPMAIQV